MQCKKRMKKYQYFSLSLVQFSPLREIFVKNFYDEIKIYEGTYTHPISDFTPFFSANCFRVFFSLSLHSILAFATHKNCTQNQNVGLIWTIFQSFQQMMVTFFCDIWRRFFCRIITFQVFLCPYILQNMDMSGNNDFGNG